MVSSQQGICDLPIRGPDQYSESSKGSSSHPMHISISNNGRNFSNGIQYHVYDSLCQNCGAFNDCRHVVSITFESCDNLYHFVKIARWFVLPYFAPFRYNKNMIMMKLYFVTLVELVLHYFHKTKIMKCSLRFSSNCKLKNATLLCCHVLSIECQILNLLFLAK